MRHPRRVAQTNANRSCKVSSVVESFRCLIELDQLTKPYYLPLDKPNLRDTFLEQMNWELGTNFKTEWEVVRPEWTPNPGTVVTERDADMVEELLEDPFFNRFGYT